MAVTEKDDFPNAVRLNGMVQSHIEDILEDLIELTDQVYTKSCSGGGAKPFKIS